MKVCIVGPTYPYRGGISHYTTLLSEHLSKHHDVKFISFSRQYPKWLFPGKTDLDTSQCQINYDKAIRILDSVNPISWVKVVGVIRKYSPDLLVIPWWVSFWAPSFWTISFFCKIFSKSKILFLCHNVVEHESNWLDKLLTKITLNNSDFFVVHSTEDRNNLLRLFPKGKIKKCYHPTYEIFQQGEFNIEETRKEMDLRGKIILFFGFVREYKGLKYLLKAIPDILEEVNATLLVVGEFWKDKDYYQELVQDLKISDRVIFVDQYIPNEEVGKYFNVADIIVQPYVSATGSGIVQIAYAFCKPVIATTVGCLPEIVDDGKTGYLVKPKNIKAITESVVKVFKEDKLSEFSDNIRKKNFLFSWDHLVNEIEKFVK